MPLTGEAKWPSAAYYRELRAANRERYRQYDKQRREGSGRERELAKKHRWRIANHARIMEDQSARRAMYLPGRRPTYAWVKAIGAMRCVSVLSGHQRVALRQAIKLTNDEIRRIKNRAKKRRHKRRLATDVGYRLMHRARERVRELIRGERVFSRLVGCSSKQLKQHIERQFDTAMTWCGYGVEWEIDHIVPLSAVRVGTATIEQVAHYLNLRPLAKDENNMKGGERVHLL